MNSFEYYSPTSLKEALKLLTTNGENAAILNGGTDIIVRMKENHFKPKVIVDIKNIEELHKIKIEDNHVFIGACVLLEDLGMHPYIKEKIPFLSEAALSVGSRQVRNRATCIGNICNASPSADTAPPLLSLNASVHIYGESGLREVSINEFFVFVKKTILNQGEIVTGISFEIDEDLTGVFYKMSRRKEVDLSTVCSTVVKSNKGYFVSYGAVAPTPIRLYKTESYLNENILSEEVIEKACLLASNEVSPISDLRATEVYRRELVEVMLRKSLSEWL